ncbi:zinc transporter [Hasllibacter halocynthiae]|uniref:Zinc transporter n=1 Tax=Hasllibacter halocynthiae TaxID=595589 RepID=A0A2T0X7K6_9RHOB|nr:CorA family divalent cation transporter [Hasllibacter halocynthiae]PRY94913.1 zinc transporter [Hasllibacter halocynthiae]
MAAFLPLECRDLSGGGAARADLRAPRPQGATRWVHGDFADPAFAAWVRGALPDPIARALLAPETRPRFASYESGFVVNMRGANLNEGAAPEDMISLRVHAAPGLVVSARHRPLASIEALRQALRAGAGPAEAGDVVAFLARAITGRVEEVSLALDDRVDALEEAILTEGAEGSGVGALRAQAIRLRRYAAPQAAALALLAEERAILGRPARASLRETADRAARTFEELEASRDRLAALDDHLDGREAARLARHANMLTIVAAIFLPLGFLTGLFGVNVGGMPGLDWGGAFWVLSGACVALGLALAAFFYVRRWF